MTSTSFPVIAHKCWHWENKTNKTLYCCFICIFFISCSTVCLVATVAGPKSLCAKVMTQDWVAHRLNRRIGQSLSDIIHSSLQSWHYYNGVSPHLQKRGKKHLKLENDTAPECSACTCHLFKYHHLKVIIKRVLLKVVRGTAFNNISDQMSTPAEPSSRQITVNMSGCSRTVRLSLLVKTTDVIHLLTSLHFLKDDKNSHRCPLTSGFFHSVDGSTDWLHHRLTMK